MKILPKSIGLLLILLLLWSCNDSGKNTSPKALNQKEISETQDNIIDDLGISIEWTAYKYTDKIGVSGTFEEYSINKKNVSGTIEDILNGIKFSISTESIDTGNAARDFKIKTYFFEAFNTPTITGTISKAKDGEGVIRLKMNNISYNTSYTYSIENDGIVIFTYLDLTKWKGEGAMAVLHKECYELHKGADGLSKMWPDVDVTIKLPLDRTVN